MSHFREHIKRIYFFFYDLPGSIYRGSYMSGHVLLNLLNKLGKRDKMRGLPSMLSLSQQQNTRGP